jgi:hypothetical protein
MENQWDQLSDTQQHAWRQFRLRQFEYEENHSPHAVFRKAKAALYIRLYKLRSVAERLPLIIEKIGTVRQLRDIIWYIAVAAKDARAACPRDIRGYLRLGGSAAGIPDGQDDRNAYPQRYYNCEPPVYNAESARASREHGVRAVVDPGGPRVSFT